MGFTDFLLFVMVCSSLSLLMVFSILWSLIWHAFGTYILILLAVIIIYKVAKKLRKTKLLFDAMDELGITRMNKEVFDNVEFIFYDDDDNVEFIFYDDDEIHNKLAESDEAQINKYKDLIEEIIKVRPDYFERGKPESEIVCDESCRGTEKVISREQFRECVSCTTTSRPDKCLYKDWL